MEQIKNFGSILGTGVCMLTVAFFDKVIYSGIGYVINLF